MTKLILEITLRDDDPVSIATVTDGLNEVLNGELYHLIADDDDKGWEYR